MRTAVITIVAVVLGGVGMYLVFEPRGEERLSAAQERVERESLAKSKKTFLGRARDDIQQPLSALKVHLQNYRKSHGRYPSTDEGLATLDNFTTRVKIRMYRHADRWNSEADSLCSPSSKRELYERYFQHLRDSVREYRREHGHTPQTSDEVRKLVFGSPYSRYLEPGEVEPEDCPAGVEPVEWELALGHNDEVFFMSPGVLLSHWQMPYVYENRNGADASVFADSPADNDPEGRFSIKVDKGVYIWSVSAKKDAEERIESYRQANRRLDRRQSFRVTQCVIGVMLLLASIAWIWWQVPRVSKIRAAACLGISVIMVALLRRAPLESMTTCYIPSLILWRNPVAVSRRRELLDKYRAGGAISDETYRKSLESMGLKPED